MFIIYLILRLFTPNKELLIWGDEARYLTTARNFYKMWNKSFYDTHPPLYAWLIKQSSRFMKDYKAGILVSLLSSIGLYWICSRLYTHLGLTPYQKLIALGFLAFNYTLIYYSNRIFRYQLIAFLGTAMLYFSLTHQWLFSTLAWGLLILTCSFAGLRAFWIWLFINPNPIVLIIPALTYGTWLWLKVRVYKRNDYYPSGLDGKIEPVRNFTLKQLISPMNFPWNYDYYGKKELAYDFKNWHKKIGGIFGCYRIKNKKLNVLIGIVALILGYFTIKGMFAAPLSLVVLTLILHYPSLFKRFLPRNSIIAIPLIGYFLAKGVPELPLQWVYFASGLLLLGFLCKSRHWILAKPCYQGQNTAKFLRSLPQDGILAEGLIAYSMAYLTNMRVIVMPHIPNKTASIQQTCLSIKAFNLHYAVFSELYKQETHLGYPTIEYIKTFNLIKKIREDNDVYYVYEVVLNN